MSTTRGNSRGITLRGTKGHCKGHLKGHRKGSGDASD